MNRPAIEASRYPSSAKAAILMMLPRCWDSRTGYRWCGGNTSKFGHWKRPYRSRHITGHSGNRRKGNIWMIILALRLNLKPQFFGNQVPDRDSDLDIPDALAFVSIVISANSPRSVSKPRQWDVFKTFKSHLLHGTFLLADTPCDLSQLLAVHNGKQD
jgi:hypothetical protein